MSLVGIDVGTSSVKLAAYTTEGRQLASVDRALAAEHRHAGWETLDPASVWAAVCSGLAELTPAIRGDPPLGLAVSASGDEVFPVAGDRALGPCLLSGDARGSNVELATLQSRPAAEWLERCGHLPERMDPINRILWWRNEQPEIAGRADQFLGWHEYLCLRLCGRAATDPGLAAKWLAFDLAAGAWSTELLDEFQLAPTLVPEVVGWGQALGPLRPALARKLGWADGAVVGVGGYDASCTALGSGVTDVDVHGLACGSWEVVVGPARIDSLDALGAAAASAIPYPGETPLAVLAQSPNGSSVGAWMARALGEPIEALERRVSATATGPSPVLAIPHLSGAICPWPNGRGSRGALFGLSLATSEVEIAQALLEAVAYELALTLQALDLADVSTRALRAAGGGSRSEWWMQLKADVTGVPIEIVDREQSGAFGAALLAGVAAGVYPTAAKAAARFSRVARVHEPDSCRADRYAATIARYRQVVTDRLATMQAA